HLCPRAGDQAALLRGSYKGRHWRLPARGPALAAELAAPAPRGDRAVRRADRQAYARPHPRPADHAGRDPELRALHAELRPVPRAGRVRAEPDARLAGPRFT